MTVLGGGARRQGDQLWRQVDVSEEAAFHAMADGELSVLRNDGTRLTYRYARHLEHANGDWTWIGKLDGAGGGREAIITFGEHAVFGTFDAAAGDAPLRLTTIAGRTWMSENLGDAPATLHPRRRSADYLLPPDKTGPLMAAAPAIAAAAASTSPTIVDVAVGYTSGLATALGGQSAAATRINDLVAITNEAYANSGINASIRLVKAMQVSYPDATDNGAALEDLTGYKSGVGQVPPDPAFDGLRSAREQYGADLVVLIRDFRTPENDDCGIAWLIGGGRSGISTSDSFFGYSVVSDGTDVDEGDGKTYFCRDETFAHELGHNMGAQHDVETAKGDNGVLDNDEYGVFSYSFGYKTGLGSGNFYTVMAYGDTGQTPYRIFSAPTKTFCGGLACGITGQSDNAQTLNQTIPTVAQFRATVVVDSSPSFPKTDVNADGNGDLIWFQQGAAQFWLMSGYVVQASQDYVVAGGLYPYAAGRFDSSAGADIAWRDQQGTVVFWLGGTTYHRSSNEYPLSFGWRLQGAMDQDGDGLDDLVFRSAIDGRVMVWWMADNAVRRAYQAFSMPAEFELLALADMDGDGDDDILFRRRSDGAIRIWRSGLDSFTQSVGPSLSKYWRMVGAGDIDGDGDDDLVWRSDISHKLNIWLMQNGAFQSAQTYDTDAARAPLMVSDANGDGKADVFWRKSDGSVSVWLGDGLAFTSRYVGNQQTSWMVFAGGR